MLLKKLWATGTVDRRPGSGRSLSAHFEENVKTVHGLVSSQDSRRQAADPQDCLWGITGDGYSVALCDPDYCKDLRLKCFKRRRAQELTDADCAARMKRANLFLLQKFPQSAIDFVFFTDEKVFSVALPDCRQNDCHGLIMWHVLSFNCIAV